MKSSSTPRTKMLISPIFDRSANPFKTKIRLDKVFAHYYIFIPMGVWKNGARGWADISDTPDTYMIGKTYLALIQFIGETLRFARKHGTPGIDGKCDSLTFDDGDQIGMPKIRCLVHLVVKKTNISSALRDDTLLPPNDLFDPKNMLGVMISLHIMDPKLHFTNLVWQLVAMNADARDPERRSYVSEHASDYYKAVDAARQTADADGNVNGDGDDASRDGNGNGGENGNGEGEGNGNGDGNGNGEAAAVGKKGRKGRGSQQQQQSKKRKRRIANGNQRRNQNVQPEWSERSIDELYRNIDEPKKAAALLIDIATGKPYVCDGGGLSSRQEIQRAFESGYGGVERLEDILSLKEALANAIIIDKNAPSNQLIEELYYTRENGANDTDGKAKDDDGVRLNDEEDESRPASFVVPIPDLVWEMTPYQMSSKYLMSSFFPWTTVTPVQRTAGQVAHILDVSLDKITTDCRLSGTIRMAACGPKDMCVAMKNAHHVSGHIELVPPSIGDSKNSGGETNITIEDEIKDMIGTHNRKTVSATRECGKGFIALRNFVTNYCAYALEGETGNGGSNDGEEAEEEGEGRKRRRPAEHQTAAPDKKTGKSDERRQHGLHSGQRKIEMRGANANDAISHGALATLDSLLETNSRIPDSVKSAAILMKSKASPNLDYFVHSKNLGMFGQMITTNMAAIRQHGIAVNELQVLMSMLSRDTGYVAFLSGLAIHLLLTGAYAGGKSKVMETVREFSVPLSVFIVNGASSKGAIPTHTPPDHPFADVAIYYDEALAAISETRKSLSADAKELSDTLSSIMTSKCLTYQTNIKVGDEIRACQIIVETNVTIGGAANEPQQNKIAKRMVWMYVHDNVNAPRNSVDMMCNPAWCNGRDSGKDGIITEHMVTHHAIILLTAKCMEIGGLSLPNADRFSVYLQATIEFLRTCYPDLVEKVRAVDVARPLAAVCTIWLATAIAYSPGLWEDGRSQTTYSVLSAPSLIPYLTIPEEICFFVITFIITIAQPNTTHTILRWLVEHGGHYPFVSYHKNPASFAEKASAATPASESSSGGKRRRSDVKALAAELSKFKVYGPRISVTGGGKSKGGSGKARALNTFLRTKRKNPNLSAQDTELLDYLEENGPVIEFPLDSRVDVRKKMRVVTKKIFDGEIHQQHIGYAYKREFVPTNGDGPDQYLRTVNPNYIKIEGSAQTFAKTFVATTNTKMMEGDVEKVFDDLRRMFVPANLLPQIPIERQDLLVAIEEHRTELRDGGYTQRYDKVPVVIDCGGQWYILIDAVIHSTNYIVNRTLEALCNETTIERDVVLPIADKRYPELLHTFRAHPVPGKTLRCANPSYAGAAEQGMLMRGVQDTIRRNSTDGSCPKTVSWSFARELESLRTYFWNNGLTTGYETCTERALHDYFITQNPNPQYLHSYPKEARDQMRDFDQATAKLGTENGADTTRSRNQNRDDDKADEEERTHRRSDARREKRHRMDRRDDDDENDSVPPSVVPVDSRNKSSRFNR